ncbi:MAG: discoidin domain-containing protein, partial [Dysgonamonadaceae bacterium]|nr:discoidin domain-containing protein [Dysgonamonadaceae bacterium]
MKKKSFIKRMAVAALGFAVLQTAPITAQMIDLDGGPMGIERVAMCVGSPIPYLSEQAKDGAPNWVQIDLGAAFPVEAVKLYPFFQVSGELGSHSHNFPSRFRIEASADESFANPYTVMDQTASDFIGYPLEIKTYRL